MSRSAEDRSVNIRYDHVFCTKDKIFMLFYLSSCLPFGVNPSPFYVENPAEGGGEVKFVKLSDDLNSNDEAFMQKPLTYSHFLFP